jgi:trimeric autotransporter adhesin
MANTNFRGITLLTGGAAIIEDTAGDNSTSILQNADIAGNITYNLPTAAGVAEDGLFLRFTNATSQVAWAAIPASVTENAAPDSITGGTNSLANIGNTMTNNTAMGIAALQDATNVVGTANNTAFGFNAASNLTTGARNTALGSQAIGTGITTGNDNTVIGHQAGLSLTSGTDNVIIGNFAMDAATDNSQTVAIGHYALGGMGAVVGGTGNTLNTAVGYQAMLVANGTGAGENTENVAVGHFCMDALTIGSYNTAVGTDALGALTTGNNNTAIGDTALGAIVTASNNTAAGYRAGAETTGANNTFFGYQAGAQAGACANCVYIGYEAGLTATGSNNTAAGYQACYATTGSNTVGIGYNALRNNTAGSNTAVGSGALFTNTSGANNVAVGYQALNLNTTSGNNTAAGYQSLLNTTGSGNTGFGYQAGISITSGSNNIAVGIGADCAATGSNQIAIGNGAVASVADDICLGRAVTGGTGGFFVRHRVYAAAASVAASWNATTSLELIENTSSQRYKTDIRDYKDEEDSRFDRICPRWYKIREENLMYPEKEKNINCAGMIAEELYDLYPEYVALDIEKKPNNIMYEKMVTLLINKVQKLRKENKNYNIRIENLRNKLLCV